MVPVSDTSQVGDARRQASRLAVSIGFDETEAGKVSIVATELAGNLVKHTPSGGVLLLRAIERDESVGVELLSLDRGAGIESVPQALEDGFSTAGSPGTGLGAVMRSSTEFDIHSLRGAGTAILSRLWRGGALPPVEGLEVGAVMVPYPGEVVCGDGWSARVREDGGTLLVVDGLGHGAGAAEASSAAVAAFRSGEDRPPAALLDGMHGALRGTRGAAVGVADVRLGGELRFAGVGNIAGVLWSPQEARSMISHNGIVGHEMRKVQEFSYPWPAGGLVILHSDGLTGRWGLEAYPGLVARHPSLIAGVLYRDFCRGRDDATVLVAREPRARSAAGAA